MSNDKIVTRDSIAYTNLDSPLGDMIAGASPRGICFLEWHDRGGVPRILERVRKRYNCEVTEATEANSYLELLATELAEYFDGARTEFEVALDPKGTPFMMRAWSELHNIPHGETRSYGEMAERLGKPGGARAAGRANGANYISIIIPCHRVIEASGGLGGYGGKIWRKKRLLELESAQTLITAE
jgi:AraC family transcriptional regulator of adaptative response/methylated-DNA-[protein]-cysteine methyltransferase